MDYPSFNSWLIYVAQRNAGISLVLLCVAIGLVWLINVRFLWGRGLAVMRWLLLIVFYGSLVVFMVKGG